MQDLKKTQSKFTKHQLETAILVMMDSVIVKNWVRSQAEFLGVDLRTPVGKEFWERETRAAAERYVR